jgi:hypothetical protein
MKQNKHGKDPQLNNLILYGCLMVFFSGWKTATGALTAALNIFCAVGGSVLCIAGGIQESKKLKK